MASFESIRTVAQQIAEKFHPQRIILFGSYAYGTPTEESDVDLLVVMPFEGKSARKSVEIIRVLNPSIPLDLVVRTQEQVTERLKMNDFFLREILEKGNVLYETAHV